MGRFDWPDRATRRLDDLTLWEAIRSQMTLLYDGSWLARMWWDVHHPPKWVDWVPPWRRHKKRCSDRLFDGFQASKVGGEHLAEFGRLTRSYSYCSTCDYWHLTRRHPVYWLVLVFGEH